MDKQELLRKKKWYGIGIWLFFIVAYGLNSGLKNSGGGFAKAEVWWLLLIQNLSVIASLFCFVMWSRLTARPCGRI